MEIFHKAFLAGVGAVTLSREKTKKIVDELIAQGKIKEQEGRRLLNEMWQKTEAMRKGVERNVRQQVATAYSKVNLATQEQMKKLERRIRELEQELEKPKRVATLKPRPVQRRRKKT